MAWVTRRVAWNYAINQMWRSWEARVDEWSAHCAALDPRPVGKYRGRIVNGEFRPPMSHLEARMNAQTAACGGVDHE